MTRILLVDDAASLAELFGKAVTERFGYHVEVVVSLDEVPTVLATSEPFDLAIVDLSFSHQPGTGLDALAAIHHTAPATVLAIMTQGDEWVAQILRDAWELLPIATVISKTAPLELQLETIQALVTEGAAAVDPAIKPLLPAERPAWRTPERFSRLIQHHGHAKVWSVLMDPELDASYKAVADRSGLKLNTVKNYRSQMLPELALHGLNDPTLRDMQDFALRCRPFLQPYVDAAFAKTVS
jgi:DNA-binding NarL/FixJ family response regulator